MINAPLNPWDIIPSIIPGIGMIDLPRRKCVGQCAFQCARSRRSRLAAKFCTGFCLMKCGIEGIMKQTVALQIVQILCPSILSQVHDRLYMSTHILQFFHSYRQMYKLDFCTFLSVIADDAEAQRSLDSCFERCNNNQKYFWQCLLSAIGQNLLEHHICE